MPRPTGRGAALLTVAGGVYLAARIVGTWELYLVAAAFAMTPLLSWLLVALTARKLDGTRTVTPERPTAGEPLVVAVRVRNGSILPGPQVSAPDASCGVSGGLGEFELESLGPRKERLVAPRPQAARRGVHRLPALNARAEDPLGLAYAQRRLGAPLELTVYPRLVPLSSCVLYPDMGVRPERGHRGPAVLGASEFRGVRPYNPGEPLSRIDWKSTAKTGSLMLRELDDPSSGGITLVLEASPDHLAGRPPDDNLEMAVDAAGSVADFALRAGRSVTLVLPQHEWQRTRLTPSADGHARLLESLARVTPQEGVRLGPSLNALLGSGRRRRRAQVLTVVVLGLDRELVQALLALRDEGAQVSVVHVDGRSFAAATARAGDAPLPRLAAERRTGDEAEPVARTRDELSLALAAAGVRSLTLRRGDDLRSALSLRLSETPYALAR